MKQKLLIGTVNMEVGGIEKTLIGLLNAIDYTKYDVDLLLLKTNGELINELPKNINIITPYKNKFLNNVCNSNNIMKKIIKHIIFNYITGKIWKNKKNYDCAISYAGYYPFIDSYISNTNSKKKLIWVHTDLNGFFKTDKFYKIRYKITKNKYNKYDNIVCVSDSIKNSFIKLMPKYKDKTIVGWNIININKNDNKYPKLSGEKIIVSVGRLCIAKRFDKLINVHKKLIDNGCNVKTYIAGDGILKKELTNMINKYNLKKSVILLGQQYNVREIIKQADLFVITSDYEGLPTVLFETLECKVPFVGTNVCGIRDVAEFIAPKQSSLLANNDIDDIYEKVYDALYNNKVNHSFKFDIKNYNKKCIENFYDILK